MNVAIIGWGKFGQAIGSLLEYNNVPFEYAEVNKPLTRHADVVFLMVPSQFMRSGIETNKEFLSPGTIIVNGAKGIEEKTRQLPYEIVASSGDYPLYYSLVGPSFAHGIKAKHPTLVSLGYQDKAHTETIIKLLQTPYFRVRATYGHEALELAGAMKNLYAILCGYAHGLGYGMNTQALLITSALHEFGRLVEAMNYRGFDPTAPGVVGDLMLTCSSEQSRNYKFGLYLAEAKDATEVTSHHTVEGYHTSHSIKAIAEEHQIDLPLAFLTQALIRDPANGRASFDQFIAGL